MGAHTDHVHTPPSQLNRAFIIGIVLNLGFVLVEAYYGWLINSLALIADASHNLSDVAGLVLAWIAFFVGKFKPNAKNTYGWQRASVLAAFFNAMLLLTAMGALLWESIERLSDMSSSSASDGIVIIAVASVGIVINTATALLFLRSQHDDMNVRGAFLHMMADAAISAGVVISGVLYLFYAWNWLDPVVSILIALIILVSTWSLLRQSLHLLFDGVPEHIDSQQVFDWLSMQKGVSDVHELHIWAMSTTDVALTVHLIMPAGHPGDAFLQQLANELNDRFAIVHPTIQIETQRVLNNCKHCIDDLHH